MVALAVSACGGGDTSGGTGSDRYGTLVYGKLPSAGTPVEGGTLSVGQITGSTPTEIFPIVSILTPPNGQLVASLYAPLYSVPDKAGAGVDYAASVAARAPGFSDGDRTVTITLKRGLKWSDGAPVDARDVLFDIALLKAAVKESPANWGQYVPGQFPESVVSATAPNAHTIVLHLNRAYNPSYFLYDQMQNQGGGVFPLPSTAWNIAAAGGSHLDNWTDPVVAKKIYDYLSKAGTAVATFGSNSLWKDVDGPFKLQSFSAANGSYVEAPNTSYGLSPKPKYSRLSVETYTSPTAELNALRTGSLDIIYGLDATELGQVSGLKHLGATVYGAPGFGWDGGFINFKDKTNHFDKVIAQNYVRAAIAHLIDQSAIIKGIFKGAAVPQYGPVPSEPASQFAPAHASKAPYPFSPSAAASLLRSHGWKVVPNGQTVCKRAGKGPHDCGAGIPSGTPLAFTWATEAETVAPSANLESEAVASEAKKVGINITIQTKSYNFLLSHYNDTSPANGEYTNDWGVSDFGGVGDVMYPTQVGYDLPGASADLGGFDDPTANALMKASVYGHDPAAVRKEASYLTTHPADFFMPEGDQLVVVAKGIGGPANSWVAPMDIGTLDLPQLWYRTSK